MTLDQLADTLVELRRYVRSHPEYVRERLEGLDFYTLKLGCDLETPRTKGYRFSQNIDVGLRHIVVNPDILRGYLYGAAAEIREMALQQDKAR